MPIINNKLTDNYTQVDDYRDIDVYSIEKHTPSIRLNKRHIGLYFLFHKEKIVYVGISSNIYTRVKRHTKDKVFDSYSFINMECGRAGRSAEDYFIRLYKPKYNSGPWCNRYIKVGGILKDILASNGLKSAEIVDGEIVLK